VKVPDTPSGAAIPGAVRKHKAEVQGVIVVQGTLVTPPVAPAVLAVEVTILLEYSSIFSYLLASQISIIKLYS